jgi:hypothetical protein
MLQSLVKKIKAHVITDSSDSSFLASTFFSSVGTAAVEGVGPPAEAAPAAGAGPQPLHYR